jgi:hypothetical protein
MTNGPGPQWFTFSISVAGNLGFWFGANGSTFPQSGYNGWALWTTTTSISNACNGIFAGTLAPISCNWNATSSGGTGMGALPSGANAGNFQPSIPVTVGQKFILLFSNDNGVNGSCTFSNTGTAQIAFCSTVTALKSNIETSNEISIYPNPFKDLVTINSNNNSEKEIEIYSVLGQKLNTFSSKEKNIKINTSEFINGIYFIKVKFDDKTILQKLIKN